MYYIIRQKVKRGLKMEELRCVVERLTYTNEENGYTARQLAELPKE